MKFLLTIFTSYVVALVLLLQPVAGAPGESAGHGSLKIRVENRTYDQVLQIFQQQTSLEYEIPPEFGRQKLPLVEIDGMSPKAALMKILEGSNYDFILIGSPGNTDTVTRLIVTNRSVRPGVSGGSAMPAASAGMNRRVNRQVVEDPFGGDMDMGFDEGNMEPMVVTPVPENPPPQAVGPGQQGPQPAGGVPQQQTPPSQAQPLQQASPLGQQQQLGQPLPPMTPQQTVPGFNQAAPQTNVPQDRRSPF